MNREATESTAGGSETPTDVAAPARAGTAADRAADGDDADDSPYGSEPLR